MSILGTIQDIILFQKGKITHPYYLKYGRIRWSVAVPVPEQPAIILFGTDIASLASLDLFLQTFYRASFNRDCVPLFIGRSCKFVSESRRTSATKNITNSARNNLVNAPSYADRSCCFVTLNAWIRNRHNCNPTGFLNNFRRMLYRIPSCYNSNCSLKISHLRYFISKDFH